MVRVVSCHHFLSQDVFLSENEPVAFCGAQGKLLVATTQHAVNVHDLDSRGNVLHTFPTVDTVKQIIFCESGNYVATIENKASWHRSMVTHVRIYFKWWIDINGQPLKVRIAGSAPLSSDSQSWNKLFEMVELPLEKTALCIACCNQTSALAVSLGAIISVFCHSTKIHEESKQTFHDFDHFVDISVPIIVQELSICENYFSCMSDKAVHVFKIECEKEDTSENQNCEVATNIEGNDPDLYDENFIEWRFESCTLMSSRDKNWDDHIKSKLHPKSFPINIHFHAIDKENEKFSSLEECELYGPLLTVKGCPVEVRIDSKVFEMFPMASSYISAVTLLFRQFVSNENKCLTGLQLIPFYQSEELKGGFADPLNAAAFSSEKCIYSLPWPNLSASVSKLRAIGCFFSTFQEGFLYDITNEIHLVSSYAYTSSLKGVVLETSLLHALTETGLETYTMHLPHSALHHIETVDGIKNIIPNYEDSVCLMGLRPFLGVDHLVMSENYLILVSSLEDSVSNSEMDGGNKSTLYSLKKPVAVQVFSDLLEVAESHKTSSPSTYYHLLSEAHMILRADLFLKNFRDKEIETLFRKSCLLLADYFLCSDSAHKLNAVPYYHLSNLSPESVVQRILDYRHQTKHCDILLPLIHYLNSVLFEERDFEFSQAQADAIISTYSEEAPDSLWKVILCSSLTGYKIDKVILVLKRRLTSKRHPLSPVSSAADTTALVQLLIQKGNFDAAQSIFLSLTKIDLVTVLSNVHNKLWDEKKLSPLGKFTMQVRPDAFVELLLNDVACKRRKVTTILHMLQNESPDADLHSLPLLKDFLEAILSDKKMLPDVDSSILVLLVKIYLKRLLESRNKNGSTTNTFSGSVCSFAVLFGSRSAWLNEMPPFNGKGISRTCTLYQKCNKDKADGQEEVYCCCWSCNEDLLRLQSLLSYMGPSDEVKELVLDFLCSAKEKKPSWLSLDVMCSSEAQAIKILIRMAPKALLPYAKEVIKTDEKKWCMLFTLLHEHMKSLPEDFPLREVYLETFHSVLAHLAETLKPIELLGLLPQEKDPIFVPYVKRCVDKHQANLLKDKIVSLGQEIKSMMLS